MTSLQEEETDAGAAQSEWKTEGHPWVDTRLQVACSWAVPTSKSSATTQTLTGNMTAFGPVDEGQRQPALGRVLVDAPPQPPLVGGSMPEPAVLAMDLTGTEIQGLQSQTAASYSNAATANATDDPTTTPAGVAASKQQQPTLRLASTFPNSSLIQNVQERYQTRMEHYLKESILPPLVALAALEEATLQMVQQRIVQEDAAEAARHISHRSSGNSNNSKALTATPHPPLFYSKPPNQYMTAPSVVAATEHTFNYTTDHTHNGGGGAAGDPTKEYLSSTPSAWLARIKLGCQQAYNEYLPQQQQEQQLIQMYTTQMMQAAVIVDTSDIELSSGRRSSSRIARIATEQWEEQKAVLDKRQRQTRSQSTSAASSSGVEVYLRGHRIASFLQQQWELEQKEGNGDPSDEEAAAASDEEEVEEEEEDDDEDDMDLFNPHLQPTYGDVLKCLRKVRMEDIQASIPYWCQETHNRTSQKARMKQLDEEEEMDNILEVGVLPLDALILGIPEETEDGLPEEEPSESMEVEEPTDTEVAKAAEAAAGDIKPADKMEVEESTDTEVVKAGETVAEDTKSTGKMGVEPTMETVKSEPQETAAPETAKAGETVAEDTKSTVKMEVEKTTETVKSEPHETTAPETSKAPDAISSGEAKASAATPSAGTEAVKADETDRTPAEQPTKVEPAAIKIDTEKVDSAFATKTPKVQAVANAALDMQDIKAEVKDEARLATDERAGEPEKEDRKKAVSAAEGSQKKEENSPSPAAESVILQWEVPSTVEKAPSKAQVYRHLQSQDHTTFGRYKFALRRKDEELERQQEEALEPEAPDDDQIQRQLDEQARRKEAERAFQNEKAWNKWRFEGIHGGYTVWPKWQLAVKSWQAERNSMEANDAAEGAASAADASADISTEAEPSAAQIEADRAKALELAQKENGEEAGSGAGSRRTRRKANSSSSTVFYGLSSQLTAKQLVELILRLCSEKSTAPTIFQLESIVAEDGTQDPVRRLRTALGKLVWRRNQLARLTPCTSWTDKALCETVRHRPLLRIALEPAADEAAPSAAATDDSIGQADSGEITTVEDIKRPPTDNKAEEDALIQYIRSLHQTELKLRKIVLEHLTDIPIPIVATAADEKKNSNEGYDSADFEDQSNIDWKKEGHQWIGKHIFRPRQMDNTNDLSHCEWFTVKAFAASVACEAADETLNVAGSSVKESPLVDRRMRFRAAPFIEEEDGVVFENEEYLVLTEAQVQVGMKAASLEQVNLDMEEEEEKANIVEHPFAGSGLSAKITLYPVEDKTSSTAPIHYTVVGHNSVLGDTNDGTTHRILVLPLGTDSNPTPAAVWATLDVSDDTEMRCQLEGDDPSNKYRIQQSDFHPESQAFAECRNIVGFLERHNKAGAFLEPVDPVALGIPDYLKVITYPMDVSTLSDKLEQGHYSNIPPKQTAGRSPIARMLNGPFRADVEVIFDNAMLFNPPKDWIHESAAAVKKAVIRKIDQISQSADLKYRRSGKHLEKQSIYIDEDSDVDMYEYESDNDDDDDYGGSRRKRKRPKGRVRPKADDNSTRAMEQGVRLQKTLSETLGLRGPFANFRIDSDAASFTLPPEWGCRRKIPQQAHKAEEPAAQGDEEVKPAVAVAASLDKHEQELLELVELTRTLEETEASGLRRSSRAIAQEDTGRKRGKKSKASDIEYLMFNEFEQKYVKSSEELSGNPAPSTRSDVEYLCERLHDSYYAELYKQVSGLLEQSVFENGNVDDNGKTDAPLGSFANGSFPPFLGRVVPASLAKHGQFSWEIRAPFQISAIRWVIRGLVQSGHVGEVEPLEQDSMSSGVIMTNHVYYTDSTLQPFEVLDTKELARRRRANNELAQSSEDEVELSEYEKLRAERVARNADRLKALGLA